MKCEVSGQTIPTTFLSKIDGTVIKDEDGKKHYVSAAVQKMYKNDKKAILTAMKSKDK